MGFRPYVPGEISFRFLSVTGTASPPIPPEEDQGGTKAAVRGWPFSDWHNGQRQCALAEGYGNRIGVDSWVKIGGDLNGSGGGFQKEKVSFPDFQSLRCFRMNLEPVSPGDLGQGIG